MRKLIDISFNMDHNISDPHVAMERYKEGIGYACFAKEHLDISIVRHIDFEGRLAENGVNFSFFRGRNKFGHLPFKTLFYLKKEKPDIVLVQGTIFPIQVIILKIFFARLSLILVQHHGNVPFKDVRKVFQQIADRFITAYLFTALGNVKIWLDDKIIKNKEKCFEVLEGSTYMKRRNKEECRARLQLTGNDIFLWVGRLDAEKDPITVLSGFDLYSEGHPSAKLYMVYQADNLLSEVKTKINDSNSLKNAVTLVGTIPHEQLEYWYSAADFYVSGSHREGSGYALIEALACGCIPVVTDIPPFRKIIGEHGFLFDPGKPDCLYNTLVQASNVPKEVLSSAIVDYFKEKLSFKTIAEDIYRICNELALK